MEVSFEDCKRELLGRANPYGLAAYKEWRQRPGYEQVVSFVEGFTHRHLLELSSQTMRQVMKRSEHPLGDVEKEEAIGFIEDFTCPFALQHIFHGFIEERRAVPTWQEFDAYIHTGARSQWLEPLRNNLVAAPDIQALIAQYGRDVAWERAKRAIRWRLGKFYLSATRELDLFTRLREVGAPIKYHLFADVLLRVDFWTPGALVCVYFENRKYRERKHPAEDYFTGVNIIHARIERQGFGRFWLAKADAVEALAAQLCGQQ
jgi:hypothetical protein